MLTWSVLVALAIILTVISLKYMNALFAVVTFGSWMAATAYHVSDRPTGIVAGDPVDAAILLIFVGIAFAILFIAIGRSGKRIGSRYTSVDGDAMREDKDDNSEEAYRERTRAALRRKSRS